MPSIPSDVTPSVFSTLFLGPDQAGDTTSKQKVDSSQTRRAAAGVSSKSGDAATDQHCVAVEAGNRSRFGVAVRARWGGYLAQLNRTIEALRVPAEHKATLKGRVAECKASFDKIEADVRAVLEAEGHGAAEVASRPDPAKVMAAAMKLAQSCHTAIGQVNELDKELKQHVHKRDVRKIVAFAVGALIAVAAGAALAVALWPVVIPALTVSGIAMLAMASSTVAAGAVGGAIGAAYCAWDLTANPEAFRHLPQRQPELSGLLTAIGEAAERWLESGDFSQEDFNWAAFATDCGGEDEARRLAIAIQHSGLPDTVKTFIGTAWQPSGEITREREAAVGADRSCPDALSPDELADMYGEDFPADGPDSSSRRSLIPGDGGPVSDVEIDDEPELYTREEIIELYWRRLGFSDRNPPAPEGVGIEASDDDEADDDSMSDNVLRREASVSSIASDTSYTTIFAVDDDEPVDNGDPIASIDPNADAAGPAEATAATAEPGQTPDVQAALNSSERWAERATRTARRYLQHLSPGLTATFPVHISDPEVKLDIMARTLAAFSLLEAARADVAAVDAAHRTRPGGIPREECLSRLALILKMEKTPHLNADVAGLGVLDDPDSYIGLSSLPELEAWAARLTWHRMASEASSLLDELDRACSHAFKHSFRGKLPGNADLEFRKEVVARRTEIQRELQRAAEEQNSPKPSSAPMLLSLV